MTEPCGYEKNRVLVLTDDHTKSHLSSLRINLDQNVCGGLTMAERVDTVMVYFSWHGFLDGLGSIALSKD